MSFVSFLISTANVQFSTEKRKKRDVSSLRNNDEPRKTKTGKQTCLLAMVKVVNYLFLLFPLLSHIWPCKNGFVKHFVGAR